MSTILSLSFPPSVYLPSTDKKEISSTVNRASVQNFFINEIKENERLKQLRWLIQKWMTGRYENIKKDCYYTDT